MSDQIPPPPVPVEPIAASQVADAAPAGHRSWRGKKTYIAGGIAAAIVLGGGFGAYAVYDRLDGGGVQPHDVLPASSQFYLRVDLDPSASQKVDLFRLVRKFPGLAKDIGITSDDQDTRELILGRALIDECDSVDYDKDVEPWLGDRVGVGGQIQDEEVVIAVQVTDEGASRDGIKKLFACGGQSYGIAYLDGYAILSDTQAKVDDAVAAAEKKSLGEQPGFVADFDDLGDQGVLSGWADLGALAQVPDLQRTLGADAKELAKAGSAAMALRADGSTIELAVLGGPEQAKSPAGGTLATLPRDTVAALSIAGAGDPMTEGFNGLAAELETTLGLSPDELEQLTGFRLPEDLATLFGDSLTLAIGAKNLETLGSSSGPDAITALDIALALRSDSAEALDLVDRLAAMAGDAGIPLVTSATDDGAVLATNQEAADAVADPSGSLGDDDTFQKVIPDDGVAGGLYLNVAAIVDAMLQADPPADIRDALEQARQIAAVGISSTREGNRSLGRVRITFE